VTPSDDRREDVRMRFAEWRATGDLQQRNALIEEHSWLASYCANRFARRGEPRDDLLQVAMLGLVKAADRFEPDRGLAFSTFAVPTMVGELRRYFRDKTWSVHVTRRAKEASRSVSMVVDELTAALGRTPTVDEIGQRAGLDAEAVLEALEVNTLRRSAALDASDPHDPDDPAADADAALAVIERGFEAAEARTVLESLLPTLPTARDREVVRLRFVCGLTQAEIAASIGVSQVQVSRIIRTNLERLRRAARRRRPRVAAGLEVG
jgi:RNA polymerase sigma-B factor